MARKTSQRRRSPTRRKRAHPVPAGRALLRLAGASALLLALVAWSPAARAAVQEVREVLFGAVATSREQEAHRALVERYASRYAIPAELAEDILHAAAEEGIDPELAFRLVRVESEFREDAVSSAGALGLTQLMPATAEWLQPGITREQIFHRETNLRLGFRFLRLLLRVYDGRIDEALHAYNRGPGTVDRIRAEGGDPANGYADRVLGRRRGEPYRGTGLVPDEQPLFVEH